MPTFPFLRLVCDLLDLFSRAYTQPNNGIKCLNWRSCLYFSISGIFASALSTVCRDSGAYDFYTSIFQVSDQNQQSQKNNCISAWPYFLSAQKLACHSSVPEADQPNVLLTEAEGALIRYTRVIKYHNFTVRCSFAKRPFF